MIWKYDEVHSKEETISYFSNRIGQMIEGEKNEIIIFDPYMRHLKSKDVETFIKIFEPHKARIVSFALVIGEKEDIEKEKKCQDISKRLGIEIKIFHCPNIHDRFWMSRDGHAFVVGHSLNGFGKKIFYVQNEHMLTDEKNQLLDYFDKHNEHIFSCRP